MKPAPVAERIRRLLVLVPYAAQSPEGVAVEDLAEKLGISPDALLEELDFLMMVGKPPFSPADFLDVYVEGDRVHVALAQSLLRPPRLTHDEALALAVGAQALLGDETGEWRDALARVLAKLEDLLLPEERARYARLSGRIVLGETVPVAGDVHEVLRRAVAERRAVVMTYWSAWRSQVGERTVHPYGILFHGGYWYLVAGPGGEEGYKLYRFDRIREARPTGEAGAYEVPSGLDLEALRPTRFLERAGEGPVRVRVSAEQARFVRERFGDARVEGAEADGAVVFALGAASWEWVSTWALAQGEAVEVLEPEGLRRKIAADARRLLDRYR